MVICDVLQVSKSGYYSWRSRPQSEQAERRDVLQAEIREIHQASKQTYGSPRVHEELAAQGICCSKNTVAKIMRESGIQAKTSKKFKVTTDSKHSRPVAENVLDRQFDQATEPNQIWVSDISVPQQAA